MLKISIIFCLEIHFVNFNLAPDCIVCKRQMEHHKHSDMAIKYIHLAVQKCKSVFLIITKVERNAKNQESMFNHYVLTATAVFST